MKGYDSSSQTVFLPRQFSFSSANLTPNGHVFSSRGPALRAALAAPSAVRPNGLGDHRDSSPDTTVVHGVASGEEEDAAEPRRQDKAVLRTAAPASSQPAPGTKDERRSVSDTGSDRSPERNDAFRRSARLTLRLKPGVKSAMQDLARDAKVSLSEASAKGLEIYARAKIRDQEETLFEPRMQAMMRREIRSSDDRHVPFEIKNAIAAEQTRILFTDLYQRLLLKEGVPLKEIHAKRDRAYAMAHANVLNIKAPRFQTLVGEYWQAADDLYARRQDQATGREAGVCGGGEAGKPDA